MIRSYKLIRIFIPLNCSKHLRLLKTSDSVEVISSPCELKARMLRTMVEKATILEILNRFFSLDVIMNPDHRNFEDRNII